jgi:uncharacterized membrane protein YhaH (DUF805 family)
MSFTEAIQAVWSKYATLQGRATRPEFWWWVLFVMLLNVATGIIDRTIIWPGLGFGMHDMTTGQPLSLIVALVLIIPGLCVTVRRFHDIDRSGWWLLIILIPIIGVLVYLFWVTRPSTDGDNRFGPPSGSAGPDAQL